MTYLITFACYGAHVHGDESPSVDRKHNVVGSPMLEPNFHRAFAERRSMDQRPYALDQPRRDVVLAAIIERCSQRSWGLIAAHVRTNHVHVIVETEVKPERCMTDLKAYASRMLNHAGFDTPDRKRWARHGSTRWLRKEENAAAAVKYVAEKQGDVMAVFVADRR